MSFHFVDRIFAYEPKVSIRGLKNVTRNESFFYWLPDGRRVLNPAVITEALCQLGGWLSILSTNFTRRTVLLADEHTEYLGMVEPGDQVDLQVETLDFGDDVVATKGTASVRGKVIVQAHCCRGYLLPLADFDDPDAVKRQFANLYRPKLEGVSRLGAEARPLPALSGPRALEALRFLDGVTETSPGARVVGFKNLAACEPYFASHFPRKPCVPGVLLLTFLGEACQYLVKSGHATPRGGRVMVPTFIQNVRFRKFVEPGDRCTLDAAVVSGDPTQDGADVRVKAVVYANERRVMQADMGFRTMLAAAAPDKARSEPSKQKAS